MQIKPVRIVITTSSSELNSADVFPELPFSDGEEDYGNGEPGDGTPVIFESDGIMVRDSENIKISYDEDSEIGADGSQTVFAFRESCPTTVSMLRCGKMTTALVFDSVNRRCWCTYNIGPIPFEITVCTESLTNTVSYENGGKIIAEYTVEIRGVAAEFNRITVKVEPSAAARRSSRRNSKTQTSPMEGDRDDHKL